MKKKQMQMTKAKTARQKVRGSMEICRVINVPPKTKDPMLPDWAQGEDVEVYAAYKCKSCGVVRENKDHRCKCGAMESSEVEVLGDMSEI